MCILSAFHFKYSIFGSKEDNQEKKPNFLFAKPTYKIGNLDKGNYRIKLMPFYLK